MRTGYQIILQSNIVTQGLQPCRRTIYKISWEGYLVTHKSQADRRESYNDKQRLYDPNLSFANAPQLTSQG
jgi:hypothetical protein